NEFAKIYEFEDKEGGGVIALEEGWRPIIADFDGDGKNELLDIDTRVRNLGDGDYWQRQSFRIWHFHDRKLKVLGTGPSWESINRRKGQWMNGFRVGNVDGDRNIEIVASVIEYTNGGVRGHIKVLEYNGRGFTEEWQLVSNFGVLIWGIADTNGFGKNEIVAESGDGKILIYYCRKVARAREVSTPSGKQGEVLIDDRP
ncbi:MAG: hypothetical protein N2381_11220, partial [Armatimonadetes bacterium]|nr:hypothetical protein [Armatimonadota bacterium]